MSTRLIVKSSPHLIQKSMKFSGPAAIGVGACADIMNPIGPFPMIFTIIGALISVLIGYVWYQKIQSDIQAAKSAGTERIDVTDLKTAHGWGQAMAYAMVVTMIVGGIWAGGEAFGAEESEGDVKVKMGLLGNLPFVADIQKKLFDIDAKLGRIEKKLDEVSEKLDDLASGGLKANPQTPEDWYSNAVIHIQRGAEAEARKCLREYLKNAKDFLDPHLQYQRILKSQEGLMGAREVYASMEGDAVSFLVARTQVQRPDVRLQQLTELMAANPEFGPGYYLLANEFTAERQEVYSLSDVLREKKHLEEFMRRLTGTATVQKYFLDKRLMEEWKTDADKRLGMIAQRGEQLAKPIMVSPTPNSSTGVWGAMLTAMEMPGVVDKMFWRVDGGEWKEASLMTNPSNGQVMGAAQITLGLVEQPIVIEARYVDKGGDESPVVRFEFNPALFLLKTHKNTLGFTKASWVSFREYPEGQLKLYFTMLTTYGSSIEEIRYSLDSESVDLIFDHHNEELPYIDIAFATKSVTVQLKFIDGEVSEKVTIPNTTRR